MTVKKTRSGKQLGAGRKPTIKDAYEKKYRLAKTLIDRVAAFARRSCISQNEAARQLLESGLKHERPKKDRTSRIVHCECGHSWRTKSSHPRCSSCKLYLRE